MSGAAAPKNNPAEFLKQVLGRPVVVKLNSGVDYRGGVPPCPAPLAPAELASRGTGVLACLDGFMNIAMEQTEEYVNGQLKAKYGDAFIRGNNGATTRAHAHNGPTAPGRPAAPDRRSARGRSLVHFHNKTQGLMRPPLAGLALAARCTSMYPLVSVCTPRPKSAVVWCPWAFRIPYRCDLVRVAHVVGPRKLRQCSTAVIVVFFGGGAPSVGPRRRPTASAGGAAARHTARFIAD